MEDDKKETDEQREEAAKKKDAPGGGAAPTDDKARVKELEDENKQLKQQVLNLQQQVQELEAASKAAANKARAAKLVAKIEKSGMAFASDEEREKELGRLVELSDDAFAATEAAYERAMQARPADSKTETSTKDSEEKPDTKAAESKRQMRTDAGVRPLDVDDTKTSLEDKLKDGFMIAYRERVGLADSGKSD